MLRWITPKPVTPDTEAERLQEIELIISRFRWFAIVIAVVFTLTEGQRRPVLSWSVNAFMLFTCILATVMLRRKLSLTQVRLLGGIVLFADLMLILAGMYADVGPVERGVSFALILLIFEGAVRWAIVGGLLGTAGAAFVLVMWMAERQDESGVPFDAGAYFYRVMMLLIVGLAVGVIVRTLDQAREGFRLQLHDLEVVNRFAVEAPRTTEPEAVQLLARLLNEDLGFERVAILFHDPDAGTLRPVATAGYPPDLRDAPLPRDVLERGVVLAEHDGLAARSFREGVPQVAVGRAGDPTLLVVDPAISSEVAVPLRAGNRRLGVLVVGSTRRDAFSVADARILEALASELAQVLENARLGEVQRRTIDDLQQLSAMKDDFIAVTSHELRTPLTALRGFARALEDKRARLSDEQVDHAVKAISRQVARLNSLIEDLLAASLIDSGRNLPRPETVDLATVVHDVVSEVDPHDGQFTFSIDLPEDTREVWADPSFLRRVLVNLVANAVRYSSDGGRIEVWASRRGSMVRVEVCDQGIGIAPEDLDRLFMKFVRLRSDHSRGGTGLGLYIVKGLVEVMGGEVGVESVPGQGSCFSFTLPVPVPAEPSPEDRIVAER